MRSRGFTLIELLVVMAIIATLLTVAMPRYFQSVERSKAVAVQQSLQVMRDAIDKYYADHGRYPGSLDELAHARYLRAVPIDPVTGTSDTWQLVPPPPSALGGGSVYDIRSGATGKTPDGKEYSEL